jgi:hypothetical protein
MTWTCRSCDPPLTFVTWGKAERHARATHAGARIEIHIEPRGKR